MTRRNGVLDPRGRIELGLLLIFFFCVGLVA